MRPNLGDWRSPHFRSLNGPPSQTERTSAELVRLREGQRFLWVWQVAQQCIQRAFSRLASAPRECSVGVSRRVYGQLFEMDLSSRPGRLFSASRRFPSTSCSS